MRRAFTVALLLVEAVFFNAVLPGHARGVITLPGTAKVPACCEARHHRSKPTPADNDRIAHCAICAFAARITIPPAVDFTPPPLGFAEFVDVSHPETVVSVIRPPVYLGRAPPILPA